MSGQPFPWALSAPHNQSNKDQSLGVGGCCVGGRDGEYDGFFRAGGRGKQGGKVRAGQ